MRGFNPRNLNTLQLVDIPASYHNGAGGVTFADGHSEIKNGSTRAPNCPSGRTRPAADDCFAQ